MINRFLSKFNESWYCEFYTHGVPNEWDSPVLIFTNREGNTFGRKRPATRIEGDDERRRGEIVHEIGQIASEFDQISRIISLGNRETEVCSPRGHQRPPEIDILSVPAGERERGSLLHREGSSCQLNFPTLAARECTPRSASLFVNRVSILCWITHPRIVANNYGVRTVLEAGSICCRQNSHQSNLSATCSSHNFSTDDVTRVWFVERWQ